MYSADSAIAGSTRAARRTGNQHAGAAMPTNTNGTATNAIRSAAVTPNSCPSMTRRL
jgi:hypothetical protein